MRGCIRRGCGCPRPREPGHEWTRAVIALGYLAGFIPLGLLLQTNAVAAILLFVAVSVGSALLIRLALYYLFVAPIIDRRR